MARGLGSDKRFLLLQRLLADLSRDFHLTPSEIAALAQEISIPPTVLRSGLSPLEAITLFLIDEKGLRISTCSKLIGRSKQGVFQAYHSAKRKFPGKLTVDPTPHDIPVGRIGERPKSALENIVTYLKEDRKLSFADIGRLIDRDQRTVWTAYHRARQK